MNGNTCCFTGYRPHRFFFSPDGLRPEQVQWALREQIRVLYAQGYRTFVSGMCVGVDLWAAAEVAELQKEDPQVRLVAAIPFEGQETYWTTADRRAYHRLLECCCRREVLFSPKEAAENAAMCYHRRNMWMVDHADTVLAVFDPRREDGRSGTAAR